MKRQEHLKLFLKNRYDMLRYAKHQNLKTLQKVVEKNIEDIKVTIGKQIKIWQD